MNDSRLSDTLIFLLAALILIKDREALESYLGNSPPQSLNTSHPPSLNTLSISIWGGSLHSSSQPNKANMNYLLTFSQAPPCHSADVNGEANPFERAFVWTTTSNAVQRTRPKILQDSQRSWLCRSRSLVYRNSELLCASPYHQRHLHSPKSAVLSTQSSSVPLSPPQSSWPMMEEGWNVHLPVTMLHTRSRFSSCSLGQDGWERDPSSNSEHLILILPRLQEKRDRMRDTWWKGLDSPTWLRGKPCLMLRALHNQPQTSEVSKGNNSSED